MMNIQKNGEKPKSRLSDNRFQLAKGVDGCTRDGGDVTETDTLAEQTDFAAILLLIRILGFSIG